MWKLLFTKPGSCITQDLKAKLNPSLDLSKASEYELVLLIHEADKLLSITMTISITKSQNLELTKCAPHTSWT